jgi:hypothetical protein
MYQTHLSLVLICIEGGERSCVHCTNVVKYTLKLDKKCSGLVLQPAGKMAARREAP